MFVCPCKCVYVCLCVRLVCWCVLMNFTYCIPLYRKVADAPCFLCVLIIALSLSVFTNLCTITHTHTHSHTRALCSRPFSPRLDDSYYLYNTMKPFYSTTIPPLFLSPSLSVLHTLSQLNPPFFLGSCHPLNFILFIRHSFSFVCLCEKQTVGHFSFFAFCLVSFHLVVMNLKFSLHPQWQNLQTLVHCKFSYFMSLS